MGVIEVIVLVVAVIAAGNVARTLKPKKMQHYKNDIIVGVDAETGRQVVYYDKRVYTTQSSLDRAIENYPSAKVLC